MRLPDRPSTLAIPSWGFGGRHLLLVADLDTGHDHGLVFAGSGAPSRPSRSAFRSPHLSRPASYLDPRTNSPHARRRPRSHGPVGSSRSIPLTRRIGRVQCPRLDRPNSSPSGDRGHPLGRRLDLRRAPAGQRAGHQTAAPRSSRAEASSGRSPAFRSPVRSHLRPGERTLKGLASAPCPPGTGDAQGAGADSRRLHEPRARHIAGQLKELVDETFSGVYGNMSEQTEWLANVRYCEPRLGPIFSNPRPRLGQARHLSEPVPQGPGGDTGACPLHRRGFAERGLRGERPGRGPRLVPPRRGGKARLHVGLDARAGCKPQVRHHPRPHLPVRRPARRAMGRGRPRGLVRKRTWRSYSAVSEPPRRSRISKACGEYGIVTARKPIEWHQPAPAPGADRHQEPRRKRDPRRASRRRLITADEILHDMRTDDQIVFLRGLKPLRCGRAIYFRRPEMASAVGRATVFGGGPRRRASQTHPMKGRR